ncbi:MAG: hypothetical protein GWP59_03575 [Chlamydiales bacterium]|nr:NYN domain-containing protein [Chlamydiales bacterium]NCF70764.1 hypothetical protein [Chlamydiales bacterium]
MKFLIDAYNLFFYINRNKNEINKSSFEDEKVVFIEKFNRLSHQSSHIFTLVFDGGEEAFFTRNHYDKVEIVYAPKGVTADSCILTLLDEGLKQKVHVVSNDNEVARGARVRLTKSISCQKFLDILNKIDFGDSFNTQAKPSNEKHYLHDYYLDVFNERLEKQGDD